MLLYIVLVLLIIICLLFLSMVWPPDSPWAPNWGTSRAVARAECRLGNISSKDIVYDLGSGGGLALIIAAKEFGSRGVGVEIDLARHLISRVRASREGVSHKLIFKRGNLFEEDISKATAVFVYLVPKTLDRLIPKFRKELKKGTPIISYRYEMNLELKKEDKKNHLRLYVI